MGYYRPRESLGFYRALASAFTICDGYHCSVLGPTDPNRLMWMSGSLGSRSGDVGGPVLETYVTNREQMYGTLNWPTVPELPHRARRRPWKVYQDPSSNALFNVLPYFKNITSPSNATEMHNARLALTPVYPAEFEADVAAGTLPKVSWIMPPIANCEHPATPPEYGEYLVSQILETLVKNPEVWASTIVFLVLYDENGGFFDHVAPPTPGPTVTALADLPAGVEPGGDLDGEYLRTADPTNAAGGAPSDWHNVLRTGRSRVSGTGVGHLTFQRRRMGSPRRLRPHLDPQVHRESVPGPGRAARFRRPAHLEVALRPGRGPHQCSPETERPCRGGAIAPVHLDGRPDRRGAKCPPRLRRHGRLRPRVPRTDQQPIRPEAG